jgi:probable addiction module antidote protein
MSTERKPPGSNGGVVLDTLESIAVFLADAFDSGDAGRVSAALAVVADAPALPELAAAAGLARHELAASMISGAMSLDATLAIMKVIDLHLPPR